MDALVVDLYEGDGYSGLDEWRKLTDAGWPWCGLTIKCSEGLFDWGKDWFTVNWPLVRIAAEEIDRYGVALSDVQVPFLRGAYHYARILQDPIKQAHLFLTRVEQAGGWGRGDLWPFVDVEGANNPPNASAGQVSDWVSVFASEIYEGCGRRPGLYGNIYLAEHGVKSTCGCQVLWISRETSTLPPVIYNRIGWTWSAVKTAKTPTLWGWQYCTDGQAHLDGYPRTCPIGSEDITSIVVANGGRQGLEWTVSHLFAEDPEDAKQAD